MAYEVESDDEYAEEEGEEALRMQQEQAEDLEDEFANMLENVVKKGQRAARASR